MTAPNYNDLHRKLEQATEHWSKDWWNTDRWLAFLVALTEYRDHFPALYRRHFSDLRAGYLARHPREKGTLGGYFDQVDQLTALGANALREVLPDFRKSLPARLDSSRSVSAS